MEIRSRQIHYQQVSHLMRATERNLDYKIQGQQLKKE
jgi:hypothetical protein